MKLSEARINDSGGIRPNIPRISDGGRLPFSPKSILAAERNAGAAEDRNLGESGDADYYSTYIVDSDGNEYEPYSLAWRYLGMFIDCDTQAEGDDDAEEEEEEGGGGNRHLDSGDDGDGNCERVLLWAAYVDHKYRGGSIGEYQFFDIETGQYDRSSCRTRRCARLDCHDPSPKTFELIGVFKESDGLEDWAEQLFKHQGYCIWDSDTYDEMESARENWPTECTRLNYFVDTDGNSLYRGLKPEQEGNIGIGIYLDETCSLESESITWFDYVSAYYNYYYGDSDQAEEAVATWQTTIMSWNIAMEPYKACLPCRAYNLNSTSQGGSDYAEQNEHRLLAEDENDGEGEEEQYGYNCYDDAGYTNCNQCYKFFAKTSLEPASTNDLERASTQGSILQIIVGGRSYGRGGYRSPPTSYTYVLFVLAAAVGIFSGIFLFLVYERVRQRRRFPALFKESLVRPKPSDDSSAFTETDSSSSKSGGAIMTMQARLALTKSLDSLGSQLNVALNQSLDKAADLWPVIVNKSASTISSGPSGSESSLDYDGYGASRSSGSSSGAEQWIEMPTKAVVSMSSLENQSSSDDDGSTDVDERWLEMRRRILNLPPSDSNVGISSHDESVSDSSSYATANQTNTVS